MRRRCSGILVCILLATAFVGDVAAQNYEYDGGQPGVEPTRGKPNIYEAIPVGPFLFSPAVHLNWQHRDNIYFTPDNEVSDWVMMGRARLQFELPINESYLLFAYTPQYRDYQDYTLDDKWSHFVDILGGFEFGNGLAIDTTYKYMYGNLENREVDPGGELYWGDRWYEKHFAAVALSYWATAKDGLSIEASYTDVSHEDPELWYDYNEFIVGAGWLHQLSEILVMDVTYRHTEYEPGPNQYFENTFRESSSDEITVGFRGMINPVIKTEFDIGYRNTSYRGADGAGNEFPDFGGLIARGYFNWTMGHHSSLRLGLLRRDYASNYGINTNYVATGGSLKYSYEYNRFSAQLRGRYQVNDYDKADVYTGEDREDPITTFSVGLGYRFSSYFSLWGGFLYENRDSSIYRYSYDYTAVTLGLVVGY